MARPRCAAGTWLAFNLDITRVMFEAGDHAQQRGFTAARRADEHAELSDLINRSTLWITSASS